MVLAGPFQNKIKIQQAAAAEKKVSVTAKTKVNHEEFYR
jgi:hypothetical protein